ncbi:MAG: hypothetical protein GC180_06885 [Bacteroidetes bacterium]|nr:hypothetical protein [Bacteroidota bacterium]
MRYTILLFLIVSFISCKKDKPSTPEPTQDYSVSYKKPGDDLATCMTDGDGDMSFILIKTSKGFYLDKIWKDGKSLGRYSVPFNGGDFVPEGILNKDLNIIAYGSLDGQPAWTDFLSPPHVLKQKQGRIFDMQIVHDSIWFCGEIVNGSSKDMLLGHINSGTFELRDTVSFGTSENDGAVDLCRGPDHSLLMLAYTYGGPSGDRDIFLYQYDSNGKQMRFRQWGGSGYDQPEMLLYAYNKIFVCGHTTSFGDPMHDAYIACLKEDDLSMDWEKAVNLDGHEGADFIVDAFNKRLALGSYAQMNPIHGGYGLLMDTDGNVIWQQKFMDFERFYQVRTFDDHLMYLGQKKNDDLDVAVQLHFY